MIDLSGCEFLQTCSPLQLTRIDDYTYAFIGSMYLKVIKDVKNIVIDGVEYEPKEKCYYRHVEINKDYYLTNNNVCRMHIDCLQLINIDIHVLYPKNIIGDSFDLFVESARNIHPLSSDKMVNLLMFIHEDLGLKEKGVTMSFGCKESKNKRDVFLFDMLENNNIASIVYYYGWSNSVNIGIGLQYIYNNDLDLKKVIERSIYPLPLHDFFHKIGYKKNIPNLIKLFKKKIRYIANGKHKPHSWSYYYSEQIKTQIINNIN